MTKGACAPCHGADAGAPRPPSQDDCSACHKSAKTLASGKPARPRASAGKGGASAGPGGKGFSHRAHADAGISCAECHPPDRIDAQTGGPPPTAPCADCHEEPGPPVPSGTRSPVPGGAGPRRR